MKQSIVVKGFVLALVAVPLVAGCKKKDGDASAGSGSAAATGSGSAATPAAGSGSAETPAAGSGSAVAAAGSGSAAGSAAAPAEPQAPWAADAGEIPATSKVTGKRDGADKGTFDRALFFKVTDQYGTTSYQLHIANGCEKFSCNYYVAMRGSVYPGDDSYKACPDATTMDINIKVEDGAELKAGPVDLDVSINGPSSGGGLSGDPLKGSSITALSDKEVKGKIAVKEGNNEAKGDFVAKNCGSVVMPKK